MINSLRKIVIAFIILLSISNIFGENMKTVFLHGLGQSPKSWDDVISILNSSGFADMDFYCPSIFEIDTNDFVYENLYESLEKNLNANNRVNICGLSLGAVLAMDYAIRNPEKVESLVLIAPQYKMPKLLLTFQNVMFRLLPESQFNEIGISKAQMIRLTSSMKKLDFEKSLAKIKCPVLVICGEKDNANKKAAKKMSKIVNASFVLIENSGHEVNVENPKKLAEIISAFWKP